MSAVYSVNATHDPQLRSWVESANREDADFPIQNLPFGVFRRAGSAEAFRGGVAIGDQVLDLAAVQEWITRGRPGFERASPGRVERAGDDEASIEAEALLACAEPALNRLMALGPGAWSALRRLVSGLLSEQAAPLSLRDALVPQASAEYAVPARIGDFTDFYASIHHATAVGRLFRPDNPLLPNYKWVPIAYHGRASSVGVSGEEFHRPTGQVLPADAERPQLLPTRRLDYELEVGVFVGPGNRLGQPVPIEQAEGHVFGLCLLNDWSARDVQAWEYQPLGPFLAKSFATTISPWIVTLEALAPFRVPWTRSPEDPQPLAYLDCGSLRSEGAIDLQLEAYLQTARMRAAGLVAQRLSHSTFRHSYWTIGQMLAHHTVNGCNLQPGDLLGSGTQSGPRPEEAGSLLELTSGGKRPLTLPGGETRTFLADGDRVTFRGWCERAAYVRIGFGEVSGTVVPATVSK